VTFVLVHGGGFGSTAWDRLIPFLGGPVLTVDLPGRGRRRSTDVKAVTAEDCARAVVDDMAAAEVTDAVLVGHSLAGVTLPRVMALAPERLRHVVFVSTIVPAHGEPVMTTMDPGVRAAVETAIAAGIYSPGAGAGLETLCNDLDEEQTAFVVSARTDDSVLLLTEPADLAGLAQPVPRTYVRLASDRRVPPPLQDACAARCGGDVVTVDAGHMVMVSKPRDLAGVLESIRLTAAPVG
jgi:pimeloyl-ACP methyl ester carboxylesterase